MTYYPTIEQAGALEQLKREEQQERDRVNAAKVAKHKKVFDAQRAVEQRAEEVRRAEAQEARQTAQVEAIRTRKRAEVLAGGGTSEDFDAWWKEHKAEELMKAGREVLEEARADQARLYTSL